MRDNPKLKLISAVELGYQGITINCRNGPKANTPLAKDARVRQAFELSIDRDALNQVVFNGEFVPGNQWINPTNPYYQQALPVPKRDVAKAKALLKEAGVTGQIALDLMVPNNPETRQVAEVLQSMAAETGFDLKIRVTEFATSLKQAEDGKYELFLIGWSGRSDPDGNSYVLPHLRRAAEQLGLLRQGRRRSGTSRRASRATRPSARRSTRRSPSKYLADGSIKYLYHRRVLVALTDKVDGYKQMPDGLIRVVGVRSSSKATAASMLAFLTQRLLQIIPTLFFVSVLIFGLQQLLPGDPALIMAGEERDPGGAGGDPRSSTA